MRVIKDATKIAIVNCIQCNSTLELHVNDVQGGDVTRSFFECAVCKQVNYISLNAFSKAFRDNLPDDTGA